MPKTVAAGIFLVNSKHQVLICHPTKHSDTLWSIPKGKVENGEKIFDAAVRETFEETNVNLSNYKLAATMEPVNYTHRKKILHPFIIYEECNTTLGNFNDFELKCNSNVPLERGGFPEMDDYRWVSFDEAKRLLHNVQAECIDKVKEWVKSVDESGGYLDKIKPCC